PASHARRTVTVSLPTRRSSDLSCANNYTEVRTWDATDACGNHSATVSQTITVQDTTPPTIGGQGGNATIECTATPSFTAPTATDARGTTTVNHRPDITTQAASA